MYLNLTKNLEKIRSEFDKLNKISKSIIKYGSIISLVILSLGSGLLVLNNTLLNYDFGFELIAKTLIKDSFTLLAETVIGSLIMDYISNKN